MSDTEQINAALGATQMEDLKVDTWAIFDPIYGPERVLAKHSYTLQNGVECVHLQVWDGRSESGSPYAPLGTGRFIVRAIHEPVMIRNFSDA